MTELPNDNLKGLDVSEEVTEARRGLGVKHSDLLEKEIQPTCQAPTAKGGRTPNDGKNLYDEVRLTTMAGGQSIHGTSAGEK